MCCMRGTTRCLSACPHCTPPLLTHRRTPTCCCWTNPPTTWTWMPFSGWKVGVGVPQGGSGHSKLCGGTTCVLPPCWPLLRFRRLAGAYSASCACPSPHVSATPSRSTGPPSRRLPSHSLPPPPPFHAGYLKQQEVPMVIVSHDREFLDQLCNKIVETEQGRAATYKGGWGAGAGTGAAAHVGASCAPRLWSWSRAGQPRTEMIGVGVLCNSGPPPGRPPGCVLRHLRVPGWLPGPLPATACRCVVVRHSRSFHPTPSSLPLSPLCRRLPATGPCLRSHPPNTPPPPHEQQSLASTSHPHHPCATTTFSPSAGNYSAYVKQKEERVAQQWVAWEKQQKEIERQKEMIQVGVRGGVGVGVGGEPRAGRAAPEAALGATRRRCRRICFWRGTGCRVEGALGVWRLMLDRAGGWTESDSGRVGLSGVAVTEWGPPALSPREQPHHPPRPPVEVDQTSSKLLLVATASNTSVQ